MGDMLLLRAFYFGLGITVISYTRVARSAERECGLQRYLIHGDRENLGARKSPGRRQVQGGDIEHNSVGA